MIFSKVLAAFGLKGKPVLLPGGQGQTWRVGDTVLKPCGMPAEAIWVAETLTALQETSRFRVAKPMRAEDGAWIAMGWQAWHFTTGETDPRRWHDVLDAGHAFHEALQGVPRPSFLDEREDP